MRALRKHTDCKWLLLYIERWLKAPMEGANGQLQERVTGTPQGGVISPLLANLFLHYAFDMWMKREYRHIRFERYADDIIVHCQTEIEANKLRIAIENRLEQCGLRLNPNKTKVVCCQKGNCGRQDTVKQFDFLGYTFRPRMAKSRIGKFFAAFTPALSKQSAILMRYRIRKWRLSLKCNRTLQEIASWVNPIVRGWINYYGRYHRSSLDPIFKALNYHLAKWVRRKYKHLSARHSKAMKWLAKIAKAQPRLFVHWQNGVW